MAKAPPKKKTTTGTKNKPAKDVQSKIIGADSGKTNPLASKALLVCVSIHMFGNRVVEQEIADDTAKNLEAEAGSFFTTKKLIGRKDLTEVTSLFSQFKAHHYQNTAPWLDNGYRVLPATHYLAYVNEARTLKDAALAKVEEFCTVTYPKLRDSAAKRLGKAYRESDYPTPAELRHRWGIEIHFTPIPDKADFRVDLPAKELAQINKDIDAQVASALENATQDLFERLYRVVLAMRDRLNKVSSEPPEKGKRKGSFRESAITNVRELCELLPKLNFTGNKDLARLAKEVSTSLGAHDAEALRDDVAMRHKAVADADVFLKSMAAYIGPQEGA
jgi:hypothetical protein